MPQGSSAVRPTNGLYLYLYVTLQLSPRLGAASGTSREV